MGLNECCGGDALSASLLCFIEENSLLGFCVLNNGSSSLASGEVNYFRPLGPNGLCCPFHSLFRFQVHFSDF